MDQNSTKEQFRPCLRSVGRWEDDKAASTASGIAVGVLSAGLNGKLILSQPLECAAFFLQLIFLCKKKKSQCDYEKTISKSKFIQNTMVSL